MGKTDVSAGRSQVAAPLFTPESANRALVFVRRVTQDIVRGYEELMSLRARFEERSTDGTGASALESLRSQIEDRIGRLETLRDELAEVGCDLKDWSNGLVDFPALHEGRKVWLCWKLGEDRIGFWHDLDTGFRGRQPIEPGFGAA
jgi:hypothetical protein